LSPVRLLRREEKRTTSRLATRALISLVDSCLVMILGGKAGLDERLKLRFGVDLSELTDRAESLLQEEYKAGEVVIRPWLTAIIRKEMSRPTRLGFEAGLIRGKILDYGCGVGTDTKKLLQQGYDAYCYEPYAREPRLWKHLEELHEMGRLYTTTENLPDESFDTILLNYVLNVIPDPAEREKVLRDVYRLLKPGGCAIIAVRSKREVEREAKRGGWERWGDGYITKHGTFQKGYTVEELKEDLREVGFEIIGELDTKTDIILFACKAPRV